MKKLGFAFSLFAASMFAAEWTGTVSDAKCGAKHAMASDAAAKCVQGCVKGGSDPVLVVDGKVYKVDSKDKFTDHLGHKVTVTGKLEGDTITVDSVKMGS